MIMTQSQMTLPTPGVSQPDPIMYVTSMAKEKESTLNAGAAVWEPLLVVTTCLPDGASSLAPFLSPNPKARAVATEPAAASAATSVASAAARPADEAATQNGSGPTLVVAAAGESLKNKDDDVAAIDKHLGGAADLEMGKTEEEKESEILKKRLDEEDLFSGMLNGAAAGAAVAACVPGAARGGAFTAEATPQDDPSNQLSESVSAFFNCAPLDGFGMTTQPSLPENALVAAAPMTYARKAAAAVALKTPDKPRARPPAPEANTGRKGGGKGMEGGRRKGCGKGETKDRNSTQGGSKAGGKSGGGGGSGAPAAAAAALLVAVAPMDPLPSGGHALPADTKPKLSSAAAKAKAPFLQHYKAAGLAPAPSPAAAPTSMKAPAVAAAETLKNKNDDVAAIDKHLGEAADLEMGKAEEEKKTLKGLKKAFDDKDMSTFADFIKMCSEMVPTDPAVAQGKALYEDMQAKVAAKNALDETFKSRNIDVVTSVLAKATVIGAEDKEVLATARELIDTIKKEQAAVAALVAACDARTLPALKKALGDAAALCLVESSTPEVSQAETFKNSLVAEAACRGALSKATSTNDSAALTKALAEAQQLGLEGSEEDAANAAYAKLSAANSGVAKLVALSTSDSMADIVAAIAEADGLGLQGEAAYGNVAARKARLEEEQQLIKDLEESMCKSDLQALSRHVATCMRLSISNKYPDVMVKAKAKAAELGQRQQAMMVLSNSVRSRDLGALEATLEKANSMGLTDAEEFTSAVSMKKKKKLVAEDAAEKTLAQAMSAQAEAPDAEDALAAFKAAYDACSVLEMSLDCMQSARVVLDRDAMIIDTETKCKTAIETMNLDLLNEALEAASQLGLRSATIEAGVTFHDELAVKEGIIKALVASSKGGITISDVEALTAAMAAGSDVISAMASRPEVMEVGPSQSRRQRRSFTELSTKMQSVLNVQEMLCACEAKGAAAEKDEIFAAPFEAPEIEMDLDVMVQLDKCPKELDAKYQKKRQTEDAPLKDNGAYEDATKKAEERNANAELKKFAFSNYPSLRSPEDFAKGVLLQKRTLKEGMLKWQQTLLPLSLTELEPENSKIAVQVHKFLLGYMGDKSMAFPATLAQDILQKGLEQPQVREKYSVVSEEKSITDEVNESKNTRNMAKTANEGNNNTNIEENMVTAPPKVTKKISTAIAEIISAIVKTSLAVLKTLLLLLLLLVSSMRYFFSLFAVSSTDEQSSVDVDKGVENGEKFRKLLSMKPMFNPDGDGVETNRTNTNGNSATRKNGLFYENKKAFTKTSRSGRRVLGKKSLMFVAAFFFAMVLQLPLLAAAMDTAALRTAVGLWCSDKDAAMATYGHITNWDTSDVTDMRSMFCGVTGASYLAYCNGGVSYCGLTKSQAFDEDLSGWDTSKVTNFAQMCNGAKEFQGAGLELWDTGKVTDMSRAFSRNSKFNADISQWDVGNVVNFQEAFIGCPMFNADIGSWNTAKATNMATMFAGCTIFNWDLSRWDIGMVTTVSVMFSSDYLFDQVLCWDVAGKDTSSMFASSPGSVDKDHPKCDCTAGNFYDSIASACSPCPAGSWSFAKADTCPYSCPDGWFRTYPGSLECTASCPPGWYVDSSIASCQACVGGTYSSLIDRTTECTDLCTAGKFSSEAATQCDDCSPGEYQDTLGQAQCVKCVAGRHSAVSGQVSSCQDECSPGSYSLEGAAICSLCGAGSFQDKPGVKSCKDCVAGKASLDTNRSSSCDTCPPNSYAPAGSPACLPCAAGSLTGAGACLNPMDTATLRLAVTAWCDDMVAAASSYGHISQWDTSSVTDMSYLFSPEVYCSGALDFNEDISSWDTSSVTSMAHMFNGRASFNADISGWDTSKVTSLSYTFHAAWGFNVDLRAWNIGSVRNYPGMVGTFWPQAYLKYCWDMNHLNNGYAHNNMFTAAWQGFCYTNEDCAKMLDYNDPSGAVCSCTAGEYYDGAVCALCPTGKISHGKTESCNACPSGFTTASAGSSSCTLESGNNGCLPGTYLPMGESDCSNCVPGKFTNTTGATSCEPCASGRVSPVAGSPIGCVDVCPAGQYSGLVPAVGCQHCKPGSYSTSAGQKWCSSCDPGRITTTFRTFTLCPSDCPPGKFAAAGSTECTFCGAGSFSALPRSEECTMCEKGEASSSMGSTDPNACISCGAGQAAEVRGSAGCESCDVGRYAANAKNDTGGGLVKQTPLKASSCNPCPAGFFAASTASLVCQACDAGKASGVGASSCILCSPGNFSTAGSSVCSSCLSGSIAPKTGATSCTTCGSGKFSTNTTNCDDCLAGKAQGFSGQGECVSCVSGFITPSAGATACAACSAGKFSSSTTNCDDCPAGKAQGVTGQGECVSCVSGFITPSAGATACAACSAGKFSSNTTNCDDCLTGKAQGVTGQGECIDCASGFSAPSAGATACSACGAGKFSSSTTNCDDCSSGKAKGSEGQGECVSCVSGFITPSAGATACAACGAGKFSSNTTNCDDCPAGKAQGVTGQGECVSCVSGFITPSAGATTCAACGAGRFSLNTTTCSDCLTGKAQGVTGQGECIDCASGFSAPSAGATACSACGAGKFSSSTTNCDDCSSGKAKGSEGQGECVSCVSGFITPSAGATTCAACGAGKFSSNTTNCDDCPAGKAQGFTGQGECFICSAGSYNPIFGQASCKDCPGDSTSLAGSTACNLCNKNFFISLQGICEPCGEGLVCDTDGGATQTFLTLRKGFWRISPSSTEIYRCPFLDACVGGTATPPSERRLGEEGASFANAYCRNGYEGTLCAVCSDTFFFEIETSVCSSCKDTSSGGGRLLSTTLLLFFALLVAVLCFGFLVRYLGPTVKNNEGALEKLKQRHSSATEGAQVVVDNGALTLTTTTKKKHVIEPKSHTMKIAKAVEVMTVTTSEKFEATVTVETKTVIKPSTPVYSILVRMQQFHVKIKSLLSFGQIAVSISFNTAISFPQNFERVLSTLNVLNLDLVPALGMGCAFDGFDYVDKMMVMTLAPVVVAIPLLVGYWRATDHKKGQGLFYAFLFLTFLVMSSTSATLFQFLKCHTFEVPGEGSRRYLFRDYSIDCDSASYQHFRLYAFAMILVYPIGIPALYSTLLFKNKDLLSNPENMFREQESFYPNVGHIVFLVDPYQTDFFWFEVMDCVRRLLLASIIGIADDKSAAAAVIGTVIALFYIAIFSELKPYKQKDDSLLAIVLTYSTALLFLAALMIKVDATSDDREDQKLFGAILFVILAAGPVFLVGFALVPILHTRYRRLVTKNETNDDGSTSRATSFDAVSSMDSVEMDDSDCVLTGISPGTSLDGMNGGYGCTL